MIFGDAGVIETATRVMLALFEQHLKKFKPFKDY